MLPEAEELRRLVREAARRAGREWWRWEDEAARLLSERGYGLEECRELSSYSPPGAGILRRRLRCLVRAPDGRRLLLFVVVSAGGNPREPCWVEYVSVGRA
jgi:hypothetical protein